MGIGGKALGVVSLAAALTFTGMYSQRFVEETPVKEITSTKVAAEPPFTDYDNFRVIDQTVGLLEGVVEDGVIEADELYRDNTRNPWRPPLNPFFAQTEPEPTANRERQNIHRPLHESDVHYEKIKELAVQGQSIMQVQAEAYKGLKERRDEIRGFLEKLQSDPVLLAQERSRFSDLDKSVHSSPQDAYAHQLGRMQEDINSIKSIIDTDMLMDKATRSNLENALNGLTNRYTTLQSTTVTAEGAPAIPVNSKFGTEFAETVANYRALIDELKEKGVHTGYAQVLADGETKKTKTNAWVAGLMAGVCAWGIVAIGYSSLMGHYRREKARKAGAAL